MKRFYYTNSNDNGEWIMNELLMNKSGIHKEQYFENNAQMNY